MKLHTQTYHYLKLAPTGFRIAEEIAIQHIARGVPSAKNLSVRMEYRRFTRLTNAFSKKLTNLKASFALHYARYNFERIPRTLRMTPAMAAGMTDRLWSVEQLIEATQ